MLSLKMRSARLLVFLLLITIPSNKVYAQDSSSDKEVGSISSIEMSDNLGRIFKDDSNAYVKELWLLGRYHGQLYRTDSSVLGDKVGYETRRFRLGTQAKLLGSLTVHAQMVSGSDASPVYNGFTELWTEWKYSDAIRLTIGQQKHRFTHDRNTSSRYISYLERSALTNQFAADYTPAFTLQGEDSSISYYTGVFSNATSSNMGRSFTDLNSGYSYIGAFYYKLNDFTEVDSAFIYASYIHSKANNKATNLNNFDDGVSGAIIVTEDSFALVSEVTSGFNSDKGNAFGINIQPSYFLSADLQLALRYQFAVSNEEQGLEAQQRYENRAGLTTGDLYNAGYVGLNYFIAMHRIKLMSGLEYSTLGGEQVWTASAMFRFFFGPHSGGAFPMNKTLQGSIFEYD